MLLEILESREVLDGNGLSADALEPETQGHSSHCCCSSCHGLLHVSFAPDTPEDYAQSVMDYAASTSSNPEFAAFQLSDTDRWSGTVTDGGGLIQGDGTTVTWSIVPDGTSIYGYNGEATAPSDLREKLDNVYGSINAWLPLFQQSFDRLSEISGVNYVYEPNDDGSAWTSSTIASGQIGVRGDVRISGHNIDGGSGVLAYNFFPNFSDMVIDTGDFTGGFYADTSANSLRLRNVLMHEAGHGLGISHVESSNAQFLMEPFINLSFDGPQFDDVLGMHRGYGDANELAGNDSAATATNLGALNSGTTITIGSDASDVGVAATDIDFVSIDDDSDTDFYSITVGANSSLDVSLTPLGPTYNQGPQDGTQTTFVASAQSDLSLAVLDSNGSTVLASVDNTSLGGSESLSDVTLTSAGEYFVRITGAQNAAQLYQLSLSAESSAPVAGVTITPTGGDIDVTEGGSSDSYTIVLNTAPVAPVTIAFSTDAQISATAASTPLVFDPTNWQTPQQVTVSAVDDETIEGNHTGVVATNVDTPFSTATLGDTSWIESTRT